MTKYADDPKGRMEIGDLQGQVAALTAQLQQAKDLCEKAYVHQSALTAERDGEKERTDDNYRSCERIKGKYSDCANDLKRSLAERDKLRAALEAVEFGDHGLMERYGPVCPKCQMPPPKHAPDCIVGLALERKA